MMIFDKIGQLVFKTSDLAEIRNISIEGGKLSHVESISKNIYVTDL